MTVRTGGHAQVAATVGVLLAMSLALLLGCSSDSASRDATPAAIEESDAEAATEVPTDDSSVDENERADAVSLKLAVYDDTEDSPGEAMEVWTEGLGSWFPDLEFGGDGTVIGPYSVDDELEVFVYPDGRDATEISFTLKITDQMVSESDRDMVQLSLYDDRLEVLSTGLSNKEATFDR